MSSVDLKSPVPQPSAMLQPQPASSAAVRPDGPASPSFESLLREAVGSREANQARLGLELSPKSAAQGKAARYDSEVVIGETAVSFQSRSIVAPASFNHSRSEPPVITAAADISLAYDPPAVSLSSPSLSGLPRLDVFTIVAPRAGLTTSKIGHSHPAHRLDGHDVGGREVTRPHPVQLAGQLAPARLSVAVEGTRADTRPTAQSARPASLYSLQFSSPALAQLVVSDSTYRIIIRGHGLSPNERERLVGDMNLMLSAMGLPFHPIHVVLPERDV